MAQILTIVPSRGRQKNHKEVVELFRETAIISDLCFGLDEDDYHNYEKMDNVIYEINPRLGMNGTLNLIANKYANKYEFICFMGDDHRPRSFGWDSLLAEPLKNSMGLSYGNDLLKGKELATAVLMNSNIVKELGFFAPPVLKHLFLDNFWVDLGRELGNLNYFHNVIIEHMHPINKKSEADEIYFNSWGLLEEDRKNYQIYKDTQFQSDLTKLKSKISNNS